MNSGKFQWLIKQIFIGVDPEYSRKRDVEIQTSIIRPEIKIVYSLTDLAKQIKKVNQNSKKFGESNMNDQARRLRESAAEAKRKV